MRKRLMLLNVIGVVLFFLLAAQLTRCNKEAVISRKKLPPLVTGFTPAYGLPGDVIIVNGTNLTNQSTTPFIFRVNGIPAEIIKVINENQIQIRIPQGSASGKISIEELSGKQVASSHNELEVLRDIPREGLVAFYPFNGSPRDVSGNQLHGTLGYPPTTPTLVTDRFGKKSQAYSFDGSNDFISMGNPDQFHMKNQMTLSGWVNVESLKNTMGLVSKTNADEEDQNKVGYQLFLQGNHVPVFDAAIYFPNQIPGAQSNFDGGISPALPLELWTFFTLVMDGPSLKFYQNGSLRYEVTKDADALSDTTRGDLLIGSFDGTTSSPSYFHGSMDDIAIYNRGLSEQEVLQLYQQTVSKY